MGIAQLRNKYRCVNEARQGGQALPEFIPLAIVLVPIFILIPFLGKLADMNQATIQASRYGAWERTVSTESDKTDAQIQDEARVRFFGANRVYIKTGDAPKAKAADNQYSVLWRDQANGRMMKTFNNANVTLPNASNPSAPSNAQALVMRTVLELYPIRDKWTPTVQGFYDARFSVDVATIRIPGFNTGTNCAGAAKTADTFTCINRHNAILADGWDSGTTGLVVTRVDRMVPSALLAKPVSWLSGGFGWIFPELTLFKPGYVEPDALPPDRVGPKVNYVH